MSPAKKWIAAIVGLLGANVTASVVLAMTASHGASQVIPDYYEHAVHYDDAIDRAAANAKLGWNVEIRVDAGEVVVSGVPGATVTVSGYQRARASDAFTVALVDGRGRLPVHGVCDVEIAVSRGAERFVERHTVEVP